MSYNSETAAERFPELPAPRRMRFVDFINRHDLFYVVPMAIAVAAFVLAILAYFS